MLFMKLLEYLKKYSLTRTEFSKRVGVSGAHITNIILGKKRPSIHLTKKIELETGGEVGLDDFLHTQTLYKAKKEKES